MFSLQEVTRYRCIQVSASPELTAVGRVHRNGAAFNQVGRTVQRNPVRNKQLVVEAPSRPNPHRGLQHPERIRTLVLATTTDMRGHLQECVLHLAEPCIIKKFMDRWTFNPTDAHQLTPLGMRHRESIHEVPNAVHIRTQEIPLHSRIVVTDKLFRFKDGTMLPVRVAPVVTTDT